MSSDDGPIVKEVTGKPLGSVNGGLAATEKLVATGALPRPRAPLPARSTAPCRYCSVYPATYTQLATRTLAPKPERS
jgi:hypothetical protein